MKKTTEMTTAEKRTLQDKLNNMLKEAISNISIHYSLFQIDPRVRITNNTTRLGSAQVTNKAILTKTKRTTKKEELWSKDPIFRISITTKECSCDKDIKNVLYHEVIHCIPGCFNHGTKFKAVAAKINSLYGVDVDTRKKLAPSNSGTDKRNGLKASVSTQDLKKKLERRIGQKFTMKRRKFTFVGFNGRPKKCCTLKNTNGELYVCDIEACAHGFGLL